MYIEHNSAHAKELEKRKNKKKKEKKTSICQYWMTEMYIVRSVGNYMYL